MAAEYCTVDDIIAVYRALTADEEARADTLIPIASSMLRMEAKKVGKDLDAMIAADEDVGEVAKMVTISAITRVLGKSDTQGAMSQMSESALGYTVSGTFVNPGEDLYFLNNELKRLGLKRQRWGVIDLYGLESTNP